MVTLKCQNCGKDFEVENWRAKRGQKFCSVKCVGESRKGKPRPDLKPGKTTLTCLQCGQEFEVWTAWVKRGRRKFCSWDCKIEHQKTLTGSKSARYGIPHTEEAKKKIAQAPKATGSNHPRWKGGQYQGNGYQWVQISTLKEKTQELVRPMTPQNGYILEHRLVMALELGRPLKASEKVHHINGKKMDNRPENLMIQDDKKHSRRHREIVRKIGELERENQSLKSLLATFLIAGLIGSSQREKI
jgi:hypothetical protein